MLAPRLTIYPEFAAAARSLARRSALVPRARPFRCRGIGPRRPWAVFPEKAEFAKVDDGADVVLVGDRSTQWYSGAGTRHT